MNSNQILLSKPFITTHEYRQLINTSEPMMQTWRVLQALNEHYPGLINQEGKNCKIYISTRVLLDICPALAGKFQLHSNEYAELKDRIDTLERELERFQEY